MKCSSTKRSKQYKYANILIFAFTFLKIIANKDVYKEKSIKNIFTKNFLIYFGSARNKNTVTILRQTLNFYFPQKYNTLVRYYK